MLKKKHRKSQFFQIAQVLRKHEKMAVFTINNVFVIKNHSQLCVFLFVFFFKVEGNYDTVLHLYSMVSFLTCTRPNRSRVGAIDKPDRPEQAFDQYDITEDPERIFTNDISIVGHEKMIIFGVFDDFISNFTYYDLY